MQESDCTCISASNYVCKAVVIAPGLSSVNINVFFKRGVQHNAFKS